MAYSMANTNSNQIVIAPKQWFATGQNDSDLVPATWLKL